MVNFTPDSTTIATLNTETDLFDVTNDRYFATWLFTNNMESGGYLHRLHLMPQLQL